MLENADIKEPIRPEVPPGTQPAEEFIRYLAAKKSVDDRALNRTVWRRLKEALRAATVGKPIQVIELGAGIGTMYERVREWDLAPSFHYTMVEMSPDYLAAFWSRNGLAGAGTLKTVAGSGPEDFARSGPDGVRTVEAICADLYDVIADPRHRERYDLIIAHAVMDLLNLEEALRGFTAITKPEGLFYLSLVYDGHTELLPSGDLEFERDLFHHYHSSMDRRESREKPSGGSRAARAIFALLAALELPVLAIGSSDWVVCPQAGRYEAEEGYFLHRIVDTIDNQLQRDAAVDPRRLAQWTGWRQAQVRAGGLTLKALNMDFLVVRPVS